MKANEAPEKIHIQPNAQDRWFEGSVPNGLPNGLFVEYTRTDAFIEKACDWLRENKNHWAIESDDPCLSGFLTDDFINDFKNYMKGE
jgi:hypothetical protein